MMGLFCGCKASNNEEYRKVIKARMIQMLLLMLLGGITMAVALVAKYVYLVTNNDRMLGVYMGLGFGLIFGGGGLIIKYNLMLKKEDKLKIDRLNNTDERILEISDKAYKIATVVLLVGIYGIGLIGGFFYPILVKILIFLLCLFLLGYIISYKFYEKRM